jgi:hypothetical protein
MRRLILLLIVFSLAFAQDDESSGFSKFVDDTYDTLEDQGEDFVLATGAAGTGLGAAGSSIYDAFKPASCGDDWLTIGGGMSTMFGLWMAPAIIVAIIVAFGIGVIYIIGQFIGSPNLIALAKDEGFQVALTVYKVTFIVVIMVAGQMWFEVFSAGSTDIVYQNNPSMIDASMAFARLMVTDMVSHYSTLLLYNMVIHTIYSSTMWFGVTWRAMYSFNLGPVLKPIIDILGTALQYLSLGISSWLLHIVTLCIIKKWMWGLFVPMGMLLRSLPYTRNAGEALISLAFAFILFYPFMFLFDYEVHKIMELNIVDSKSAMGSFINKSGIFGVFGAVIAVMFLMAGVFMPFFLGGALSLGFELIRGAVYYIVIMSILLPFLNIFVTLTAAKEAAEFSRVEVSFMSFLKIL